MQKKHKGHNKQAREHIKPNAWHKRLCKVLRDVGAMLKQVLNFLIRSLKQRLVAPTTVHRIKIGMHFSLLSLNFSEETECRLSDALNDS